MMVPSQIKAQTFTPTGRGTYKSGEVDSFIQRVYVNYNELYSENAELKKKFASLRDIIEEYNAGKNAIATALVKAQAIADETVKNAKAEAEASLLEAEEKAKKLVEEKTKEADGYAEEKKRLAEESFEKAKEDLERIMAQTREESERYIAQINEQARQIIDDANAKAAKIVASAYADAKMALDKKDEIVASAQKEFASVKAVLSAFKQDTLGLLRGLIPSLEALNVPEFEITNEDVSLPEADSFASQTVEEPFAASLVTDEPVSVADVIEETQEDEVSDTSESVPLDDSDKDVKAYIPDAEEYIKQIFSDISLPHTDSTDVFSAPEAEKEEKHSGITVTDDIDILSDDE